MTTQTVTSYKGEKFNVLSSTESQVTLRHIPSSYIYICYPHLHNKMLDGATGESFEGFGRIDQATLLKLLNN
mgnify:CR=1 FL=1